LDAQLADPYALVRQAIPWLQTASPEKNEVSSCEDLEDDYVERIEVREAKQGRFLGLRLSLSACSKSYITKG
jgi:hypothetical protein